MNTLNGGRRITARTRRVASREVGRPPGRATAYTRAPTPGRVSWAPHPLVHRSSWRIVLAWVVLAIVAIPTLFALRSAGSVSVPETTEVVQVQAGESLSELAGRVAPGVPAAAVVERIVELNGLPSASVRVGESLVVPFG